MRNLQVRVELAEMIQTDQSELTQQLVSDVAVGYIECRHCGYAIAFDEEPGDAHR